MTDPSDNDTLQFRAKLHRRASKGQPLRDDEIDYITKKSEELGEATTEATEKKKLTTDQVIQPARIRWANAADRILSKPANEIDMADARELQSEETRAFEVLPAPGSASSHVLSVAEKKEQGS